MMANRCSWGRRLPGGFVLAAVAAGLVLGVCAMAAGQAQSQPAPAEEPVDDLVRKLGSESWRAREEAQKKLIEAGEPAAEELSRALDSPDPEVRQRAQTILGTIRQNSLEARNTAVRKNVLWTSSVKEGVDGPASGAKAVLCFLDGQGALRAVDARTGKDRWKFSEWDGAAQPARFAGLRDAPVIADGLVYVAFPTGRLYAIELETGKLKWRSASADGFGPPLVADEVVYVGGAGGGLHALDTATGKQKWAAPTDRGVLARAVVLGKTVYVADQSGKVHALDPASGKGGLLAADLQGRPISLAAAGEETLVVRTTDGLSALDVGTGKSRWTCALPKPDGMQMLNVRIQVDGRQMDAEDLTVQLYGSDSLSCSDGVVCAVSSQQIHAVDAAKGTVLWTFEPKADEEQGQQQVLQQVIVQGGVVMVVGRAGGRLIMRGGALLLSAPWIEGGMVYVGSPYGLHAVELKSGQEIWRLDTEQPVQHRPTVADGAIYFSSGPGMAGMMMVNAGADRAQVGPNKQGPAELRAVRLLAPAAKAK